MSNYFRTFLLMALLTALFVWLGGLVGGRTGAVIAFVIAGAMNVFAYWNSDKLVLRRYQAQEVGPQENSRLYMIVNRLAQSAQIPMPKVYIIPSSTPNAFATGRNPENAAVAATQGLLDMLDDDEIEGVMAHELAHVKNRDILTGTIAATLVGAIAMLAQFARFGMMRSRGRQNPISLILIVIAAPLAAMLIRMAISRVREYAADKG
ncbi:M48 family metalloprotease, partial [candidate division KSB1 bacterium]|nr:M48 family metalloprotease [candidate division KSB1 bacterium]